MGKGPGEYESPGPSLGVDVMIETDPKLPAKPPLITEASSSEEPDMDGLPSSDHRTTEAIR